MWGSPIWSNITSDIAWSNIEYIEYLNKLLKLNLPLLCFCCCTSLGWLITDSPGHQLKWLKGLHTYPHIGHIKRVH